MWFGLHDWFVLERQPRFFVNPLDLSYRHKLPIWGGILVTTTAIAVSAVLMSQTYAEMQEDLLIDTETLAHAIEPEVSAAIANGNHERAREVVQKPLADERTGPSHAGIAQNIIVVDRDDRVFAAAYSDMDVPGAPAVSLGADFNAAIGKLRGSGADQAHVTQLAEFQRMLYSTPIREGDDRQGTLIVVLSKGSFLPRFFELSRYTLIATAVLLGLLLPVNWYWGRRMAEPLVQITKRLEQIGSRWPEPIDPALYTHVDEIGSLFQTYNRMLAQLQEKTDLEQQVVQADRLAALGQLAAGVAHEINNPLGGMLMAIDTLKSRSIPDAHTAKTIALLERGLAQIKETVGALLVEAKVKSRNLSRTDVEDVLMLVLPQIHKKSLGIDWRNDIAGVVALPATLVRQVLINLLLNATQAADQQGRIACRVCVEDARLCMVVTNDGRVLSNEEMGHLFEPFSPLSESGHGLGLWVSYQIVHQLGGELQASQYEGRMRFIAEIPVGEATQ